VGAGAPLVTFACFISSMTLPRRQAFPAEG
jgi:hypothetical protein